MWIYNSAATIRQGAATGSSAANNADTQVLKAKLSLNWTGPFKILAVGPLASAPDNRPLADKLLYLDLPSPTCQAQTPKNAYPLHVASPAKTPTTLTTCPAFYRPASLNMYSTSTRPSLHHTTSQPTTSQLHSNDW